MSPKLLRVWSHGSRTHWSQFSDISKVRCCFMCFCAVSEGFQLFRILWLSLFEWQRVTVGVLRKTVKCDLPGVGPSRACGLNRCCHIPAGSSALSGPKSLCSVKFSSNISTFALGTRFWEPHANVGDTRHDNMKRRRAEGRGESLSAFSNGSRTVRKNWPWNLKRRNPSWWQHHVNRWWWSWLWRCQRFRNSLASEGSVPLLN